MRRIALIGGTGLDAWPGAGESLTPTTPWGAPSAPLRVIRREPVELLFLARHGAEHSIAPHRVNYRANLHALQQAGAQAVYAVNAVGGIAQGFGPGVLAVADQLIDYTWGREHTYADGPDAPLVHVEFGEPFSPEPRRRLLAAATAVGLTVRDGGCVGVTQGPRLETAAEIRRLRRDGCDMVGMTSLPEAALARELGLPYAALCVVSNWAAGLEDAPISQRAIAATLEEAMVNVRTMVEALLDPPHPA